MPSTITLTIKWRNGQGDTTATEVTNIHYSGGNLMFHGVINGVEDDYSYPLSTIKKVKKHEG